MTPSGAAEHRGAAYVVGAVSTAKASAREVAERVVFAVKTAPTGLAVVGSVVGVILTPRGAAEHRGAAYVVGAVLTANGLIQDPL